MRAAQSEENVHCVQADFVFLFLKDRSTALQDKYINPFTDFGFKKLFGSEPNKDFFEAAEIAKFMPDKKVKYEESLKYYRDLKNLPLTEAEIIKFAQGFTTRIIVARLHYKGRLLYAMGRQLLLSLHCCFFQRLFFFSKA